MSRWLAIPVAMALLTSGCTTGGRIFAGVAAVSAVVALHDAGSPFNDVRTSADHTEAAAGVWAVIALACALTSIGFEVFARPAGSEPEPSPPHVADVSMAEAPPLVAHGSARDARAARFTEQAYFAARVGHCTAVKFLGDKVRAFDAAYFASVFAVDPTIARCL